MGIRMAWDALGFVCALSLTLFGVTGACVAGTLALPHLIRPVLFVAIPCLVVGPLYAGICLIVHRLASHDEVAYGELWSGAMRMYGHAVGLAAIELTLAAVAALDALLFFGQGGAIGMAIGALFLYALIFWAMNCVYHWPLLIVCREGVLLRDDGLRPGLISVLRNGLLMTVSAPGFTSGLLVAIIAVLILMGVTGVGMALLGPGLAACLATRATRDQLIRFHVIPPDPDPNAPVEPDQWDVE